MKTANLDSIGEYLEKVIKLSLPMKELTAAMTQAESELIAWGANPQDIQIQANSYRDGELRIFAFKGLPSEVYEKMKELELQDKAESQALALRMESSTSEIKTYEQHLSQMVARRQRILDSSLERRSDLEEIRKALQDQVKREDINNKEAKEKSLAKVEKTIEYSEKKVENLKKEISYLKEDEETLKKHGPVSGLVLKYLTLSKFNKCVEEFSRTSKTYQEMQEKVNELKVQGVTMNEVYRAQKDLDYAFKMMLNQVRHVSFFKEEIANFKN